MTTFGFTDLLETTLQNSSPVGFYSDETTTGGQDPRLRGAQKISIAARFAEDGNEFEWVRRLRVDFKDHLPSGEVKSADVLKLCEQNPSAKQFITKHVRDAQIFVIDVFQDYYDTCNALRDIAPDPKDPIGSLSAKLKVAKEIIHQGLNSHKELALHRSLAPIVDRLRQQAGIAGQDLMSIVDSEAFSSMSEQAMREFVVRFTVTFGDVVNPEVRARSIEQAITRTCFYAGHIAVEVIRRSTQHDIRFDKGSQKSMDELVKADTHLQNELESLRTENLMRPRRSISQDDSALVLGIQAADIAAGYARAQFEKLFQGDTQATARLLREEFSGVLYNTRWL